MLPGRSVTRAIRGTSGYNGRQDVHASWRCPNGPALRVTSVGLRIACAAKRGRP